MSDQLIEQSVQELQNVLKNQSGWVKVHAAEYLIWTANKAGVKDIYLKEEKLYGNQSPYRIGIWRVLAQEADLQDEKKQWTDKILHAFLDTNGADRIHAAETLAKLNLSPVSRNRQITADALNSNNKSLSLYTKWSTGYTSGDSMATVRRDFYDMIISGNEDLQSTRLAAYVLRNSGELPSYEWDSLAKAAIAKPAGYEAKINLLSAAFVTAPGNKTGSELFLKVYDALQPFADVPEKGYRMEVAASLAEKGSYDDLPLLISLLQNKNPIGKEEEDADVRATAAYAILRILKGSGQSLNETGNKGT